MQDEIEQLEKKIAEGLEAVRELKRLTAEEQRKDRPKLKLVRGGLLGAGIWAGVEWLRNYRRIAVALAATSITVGGAVIAEHPGSPGSDPPEAISPPASVRPSAPPPTRPKPTPTPQRTSPPRTQVPMRIPPPAPPSTVLPTETKEPTQVPTSSSMTPASEAPPITPVASITVQPTLPVVTITPTSCTINLLGIRVCLPLG